MAFSLLVLHGPNLAKRAREELDPQLEARAAALGVELTIVQANGEEGLLDALHEHAEAVDAVLVNPGVLAPHAFALAEGLGSIGLPSLEVLLDVPRAPSVLTAVVKAQRVGADAYREALEQLAALAPENKEKRPKKALPSSAPVPRGKSIGRKAPAAAPPPEASKGKSIGRAHGAEKKDTSAGLTRAEVRGRIKQRLQQESSAEELAQWARERWTSLQGGAACEAGAKDLLENVLLTLMAGAKVSDAMLVAQMAKLDS
jgi:3-dehydroquinate dehydratase-2